MCGIYGLGHMEGEVRDVFGVGGTIPKGCSGFSLGLGEAAKRKQSKGFSSGRPTSFVVYAHSSLVGYI